MDYEHRSDCWYNRVCTYADCQGCIRFMEMSHLLHESDIPKARQYPVSLIPFEEDYDAFVRLAEIKDDITEFVNLGKNLYIGSEKTGNGKTTWSIKLLLKYFDSVWAGNGFQARGLFVHVPTLLSKLKNFQEPLSEEYKDKLLNCDVVVFDDIAVSGISSYDYNNLLVYIDNRLLNGKSNIFTSNKITEDKLSQVLGDRLTSRIWQTSEIVIFTGKDRRNGKSTDNK